MLKVLVAASLCISAFGVAAGQDAGITFRRGVAPLEGSVVSISQDGVHFAPANSSGEDRILIPLDHIASVRGDKLDEWKPLQRTSEMLWRGRVRLERGDYAGAEPLFETLSAAYKDRTGPTAELAHGGLLICRLSRGAHVLTVEAFIDYCAAWEFNNTPARLIGLSRRLDGVSDLKVDPSMIAIIDPTYGLCPSLPPIFVSLSSVRVQAGRVTHVRGERAGHLATLYAAAMKGEFESVAAVLGDAPPSTDVGVTLVWEVVAARHGSDEVRPLARTMLSKRLSSPQPAWVLVWCHAALGRSLVKESDQDLQMLGVAELAFLPAAYERTVPYLTGISLAESSLAMLRSGNDIAAVSLRERINDRFPSHPVLEWEPIRHWNTSHAVQLLRSIGSDTPSNSPTVDNNAPPSAESDSSKPR